MVFFIDLQYGITDHDAAKCVTAKLKDRTGASSKNDIPMFFGYDQPLC